MKCSLFLRKWLPQDHTVKSLLGPEPQSRGQLRVMVKNTGFGGYQPGLYNRRKASHTFVIIFRFLGKPKNIDWKELALVMFPNEYYKISAIL